MPELVYLLCGMASLGCGFLLLRNYLRNRTRLVFWTLLCFFGLAVSNGVLVLDLIVIPQADLSLYRTGMSLLAFSGALFGFIWELT